MNYKGHDYIWKNPNTGEFVRIGSDEHSPEGYYPCNENGTFISGEMIDETSKVEENWKQFKKI